MAYSTCPKCTSTSFEIEEVSLNKLNYKMLFVQCSKCGAVVSIIPYYDPGVLAKDNQTEIANIKEQLTHVLQALRILQNKIN